MTLYHNSRQPKVDRQAKPISDNEKEKVGFKDARWPSLGADLQQIIYTGKLMIPLSLTVKQLELLGSDVLCPQGKFPPPEAERLAYPDEWAKFIRNFLAMPQWAYRRHSMGVIIDLLRSYHFVNGWFTYRPNHGDVIPETKPVVDPSLLVGGASEWLKPKA